MEQNDDAQSTPRLGKMPRKVKGKHRWIAVATFVTNKAELIHSQQERAPIMLTSEKLVDVSYGCIDCEKPFPSPEPCTAKEFPWVDNS